MERGVDGLYRSILFDMDNTLLQSKINFKEMRKALIEHIERLDLVKEESWERFHTPAQVLEHAKSLPGTPKNIEKELWHIVAQYELLGMEDVCLEEGVSEGLQQLKDKDFRLAIVTNNAYDTACTALQDMRIATYFEVIVGRDQMSQLKPSPSGIEYALEELVCPPHEAVMVGDSWIDGKAAEIAKVDFIAYKAKEYMLARQNIDPVLSVTHFDDVVQWLLCFHK